MNKYVYAAIAVAAVIFGGFYLTRDGDTDVAGSSGAPVSGTGAAIVQVSVPDSLPETAQIGKRVFEAKCIACHGANASGKEGSGPPLVHKIYEPGHHGNAAFWIATQRGVRSHHWKFGNMPPVDGLSKAEVDAIVAYVRTLQKENGIF